MTTTDRRPPWHPPQPFLRADIERSYIEREMFARVEHASWSEFQAIRDKIATEAAGMPDDDLAVDELRARLDAFEDERARYDALSERPLDLGPKGRGERQRLKERHAGALAAGEGTWQPVTGTAVEERVSTIHGRDELAILSQANVCQLDAAATVRRLGLAPIDADQYSLVRYTVPYYAPPVPTVQEMWIEWAMMHASARLIGTAMRSDLWLESDRGNDPQKLASRDIDRAIRRMFDRGGALPTGAKFYSVKLTAEMTRYLAGCT